MEPWDINTPEGMRAAIAWTQRYVSLYREGGIWGIPRSGASYQIFKSRRVAVRVTTEKDGPLERVFAAMGWTVETGHNPPISFAE